MPSPDVTRFDSSLFDKMLFNGGLYVAKTASAIPLTITGKDVSSNSIPLYISGPKPVSNTIPLFVKVQTPAPVSSTLNLFVKTNPIPKVTNSIPLTIYGSALADSANGHVVGSIPLYMGPSPPYTQTLNLYICGVAKQYSLSSTLNLFIKNSPPVVSGQIPLFIKNNYVVANNILPLYIKGLGLNPGYIPASGTLNLFIQGYGSGRFTSPISIDGSIPLIIKGKVVLVSLQELSNVLPLFLQTNTSFPAEATIPLYIVGAVPAQVSATIPLVIPKTKLVNAIHLYVHGF